MLCLPLPLNRNPSLNYLNPTQPRIIGTKEIGPLQNPFLTMFGIVLDRDPVRNQRPQFGPNLTKSIYRFPMRLVTRNLNINRRPMKTSKLIGLILRNYSHHRRVISIRLFSNRITRITTLTRGNRRKQSIMRPHRLRRVISIVTVRTTKNDRRGLMTLPRF